MSPDPTPSNPVLSLIEQRILGVLIEKQKTTADAYPMTLNALVAGANQKSNRDPVMNLSAEQVEGTLEELNRRGLVVRVISGRVDKWKHVLYEAWNVEKAELAVLAELFMRGPQTEGELRGRVSRMDPIEDIETLRGMCKKLSGRGFVVYLTPEGRRGTVVTHGCYQPEFLNRLKSQYVGALTAEDAAHLATPSPIGAGGPARAGAALEEIAEMRKQLAELRLTVESHAVQLRRLHEQFGIEPAGG